MQPLYSEKCRINLFNKSVEKENYDSAVKEWYFRHEVIDTSHAKSSCPENAAAKCELCEHEDLRWQFVIYNDNNGNQMKVGSSCIKQFNIALIEKDGRKIYGKDRNAKINKLINLARIGVSNELTFKALNDLCALNGNLERNNMFIECWTQLKVNGEIEPKLALFLIKNFIECGMDYKELDMKINVKKRICADQIKNMNKNGYSLIRTFLNDNSRMKFD